MSSQYAEALVADYPDLLAALERLAPQAQGAIDQGWSPFSAFAEPEEITRMRRALLALTRDAVAAITAEIEQRGESSAAPETYVAVAHAVVLGVWLGQRGLARVPED